MEYRNESQFFGGSQYLERLDKLSSLYNEANLIHDVKLMYDLLITFKFELIPYMTKKEIEDTTKNINESKKKLIEYLKEDEANNRIKMVKRKNPHQRVYYDFTIKEQLRDYLNIQLREQFQIIIKRSGLLMADKMSHTDAALSGFR